MGLVLLPLDMSIVFAIIESDPGVAYYWLTLGFFLPS